MIFSVPSSKTFSFLNTNTLIIYKPTWSFLFSWCRLSPFSFSLLMMLYVYIKTCMKITHIHMYKRLKSSSHVVKLLRYSWTGFMAAKNIYAYHTNVNLTHFSWWKLLLANHLPLFYLSFNASVKSLHIHTASLHVWSNTHFERNSCRETEFS